MLFILLRTRLPAQKSRRALRLENLALRHQLNVLPRHAEEATLRESKQAPFWVILTKMLKGWRLPFSPVHPETVVVIQALSDRLVRYPELEEARSPPVGGHRQSIPRPNHVEDDLRHTRRDDVALSQVVLGHAWGTRRSIDCVWDVFGMCSTFERGFGR